MKMKKGDVLALNSRYFNIGALGKLLWEVVGTPEDDKFGQYRLCAMNGLGVLKNYRAYIDKDFTYFRSDTPNAEQVEISTQVDEIFNLVLNLLETNIVDFDSEYYIRYLVHFEASIFARTKTHHYNVVGSKDLETFRRYPLDDYSKGLIRVYHEGISISPNFMKEPG